MCHDYICIYSNVMSIKDIVVGAVISECRIVNRFIKKV
jgi:hypothetical protein